MRVIDEVVTLLELIKKEGVGKTSGKPYSFYVGYIGDDEFNKLPVNLDRSIAEDGVVPEWIFTAADKKDRIVCDLNFIQKGFDIKAEISNIRKYE